MKITYNGKEYEGEAIDILLEIKNSNMFTEDVGYREYIKGLSERTKEFYGEKLDARPKEILKTLERLSIITVEEE